jgi:hypothetical protein
MEAKLNTLQTVEIEADLPKKYNSDYSLAATKQQHSIKIFRNLFQP